MDGVYEKFLDMTLHTSFSEAVFKYFELLLELTEDTLLIEQQGRHRPCTYRNE